MAGLVPAIVTDPEGRGVSMFAYMNAEALQLIIGAGEPDSGAGRATLWRKGTTSGNRLFVQDILLD